MHVKNALSHLTPSGFNKDGILLALWSPMATLSLCVMTGDMLSFFPLSPSFQVFSEAL